MGPTWGPSGTDRTQVGPMLAPWTLLCGSQDFVYNICQCNFLKENVCIFMEISLKFVCKGPVDRKSVLVKDKLLPKPVMTQFNGTYSQYIPRNIPMGQALLYFVKSPWIIWVNWPCELTMKSLCNLYKTKHIKTMCVSYWEYCTLKLPTCIR